MDAAQYRGLSNLLPFMKSDYNEAGVLTTTPKDRQCIFMDAMYNAQYDVNVLASAFNMNKADFEGRLHLIDDWTSFDNKRFEEIRENCDGIEEVTAAELPLLADVKAVLIDENWFQVYDNKNKFTEDYVGSGLMWNYWYHTWKTISASPFANAVVFVASGATITVPDSFKVKVASKDLSETSVVVTFELDDATSLQPSDVSFVQTDALADDFVAVQKYGAYLSSVDNIAKTYVLKATINGVEYTTGNTAVAIFGQDVGDEITFTKVS